MPQTVPRPWLDPARALAPSLVRWRRHIHQHPELSFHEVETAQYIANELRLMGLEPQHILPNAVIAEVGDAGRGPTIALRADIDALPISEETGLPFASLTPGVMHACGHDGHTAILLGVARLLADQRENIPGRIRLLFQPAEEIPPGGAEQLIAAGVLNGVSAIAGLHLWSPLPSGTAAAIPGPAMAASDRFTITIQGRGGHGAMPHRCIDALETASRIVVALQSIVSRSVDPLDAAVVTVGRFSSGTAFNVIAGEAVLEGTVRTLREEVRTLVRERLHTVVEHTAASASARADIEYIEGDPAVQNDPGVTAIVADIAEEHLGGGAIRSGPPEMAAEDFACYLQHVPGSFLLLGTANEHRHSTFPHHHPQFTIDEDVMPVGVSILTETAYRLLERFAS